MQLLDLDALRIAEFLNLGSDLKEILNNYDLESLGLGLVGKAMSSSFLHVAEMYAKEKGSLLGKEIELGDARRDNCILGILGVSESYQRHFDPDIAFAARQVIQTISKFGKNIAIQNYQTETESLRNLISEFKEDAASRNAIEKLGLAAWVAEMEAANEDFAKNFQNQGFQGSTSTGNIKEQRAATKRHFDAFMALLLTLNQVSANEKREKLWLEIKSLLEKNQEILNSRKIFGL
jgi:hypothetical protein